MKLEGGADFGIGIVSDPTTTMVIEFRSDGTAISHMHIEVGYDHSTKNAWKVLEEKSDQLTIKTQTSSSTRKKRVTFLDKDTIRFDELDENKSRFPLLIFRRIVPSPDGKSSRDLGR